MPRTSQPGSVPIADEVSAVTRIRPRRILATMNQRDGGLPAEVGQPPTDGGLGGSDWQERAVERRLSRARARALARSSQFLATALQLVEESGSAAFTVQALIDRSNLSLRAFYQHFGGKDELLLALYENVTSQFTEAIRQEVAAVTGPMKQLEAFCRGFLSRAESSQIVGGRVVLIYNLSLEIERPAEFAKVWEPHQKLLTKILMACARGDLIRKDLKIKQMTTLLTSTLTSLAQFNALHGGTQTTSLNEHDIWMWCRQAVSPPQTKDVVNMGAERAARRSTQRRARQPQGRTASKSRKN